MNIRFLTYRILAFIAITMLAACSDEDDNILPDEVDGVEMKGVIPTMTRAGSVAELEDYVGKEEFADKDRAVFVTIKRTNNPIEQFTYENIEFVCAASTSAEGVKSIGWSRDKTKGTGGGASNPDRIYWSDAINPHTFIGFCAPLQGSGAKEFDWKNSGGVYYGSIGDPEVYSSENPENNLIDFRSTFNSEGTETQSGNVELCKNDILLTHSTAIKASDAIAKLQFYHGLAQVRVIVNISDFAAGGGDDTKSVVSDMILKDMLMMYKWNLQSVATTALVSTDQEVINSLYSGASVSYEQRKNVNLWIPKPKGVGEKSSRTFTFYGLAVPTEITEVPLEFSFKVTYPDPMKPAVMKEHTYTASIKDIRFDAGKCTTISISLNHKNEKMTIGAEYDDWEFIDTPNEGELKKNATFLASTDRAKVTIIGDEKATVDDATWLYVDAKDNNKIKDIYGNDGSKAHPFQISTAAQLLAFAYEVKGGTDAKPRVSTSYIDLDGTTKTLSGAFDFTNYYVALDAGLTLQATEKKTKKELEIENPNIDKSSGSAYDNAPSAVLDWIGIGDTGKPFNGEFIGGVRLISRLNGKPFFIELGPKAHVDQLILEDVIEIDGDGGFAETNKGVICACKVDGNVSSQSASKPVGSFVGTNSGLIFACYHIGDLTANSASVVGGLVGENTASGKIVASYNMGKITATGTYKFGVLGKGYTPDGQTSCSESVYGCFYDHTKASNVSNVAPDGSTSTAFPSVQKTTIEMIRNSFAGVSTSTEVNCLNGIINQWVDDNYDNIKAKQGEEWAVHFKSHYYVSQPANYPYVY